MFRHPDRSCSWNDKRILASTKLTCITENKDFMCTDPLYRVLILRYNIMYLDIIPLWLYRLGFDSNWPHQKSWTSPRPHCTFFFSSTVFYSEPENTIINKEIVKIVYLNPYHSFTSSLYNKHDKWVLVTFYILFLYTLTVPFLSKLKRFLNFLNTV